VKESRMFFSKVVTKLFTDVDIYIKDKRGSARGRIEEDKYDESEE
jgi:hypothetical protein